MFIRLNPEGVGGFFFGSEDSEKNMGDAYQGKINSRK